MDRLRNNRGVALPLAIFALVIVGALVAASFFVGTQEQRVGRNTVSQQQAFSAAEAGAQATVADWNRTDFNTLAIGGTINIGADLGGRNGWYRGEVRRLNDKLFLVSAEGFSADSTTRQHVGLLVRLRPIEITINAAMETQGATQIGGSSFINGNDTPPASWTDCPALEPAKPGIRIDDVDDITTAGCQGLSCVSGNPPVEEDPTINDSTLTTFGDASFQELRTLANKFLNGGNYRIDQSTIGSECNYGDLSNWGDARPPPRPCGNYWPVIWVDGDINVNGVQGQGILLVDGDLRVQGNFQFYGPVLVNGNLTTTGTGGHFFGGVVAANVALDQSTILGDAVINYSNCALQKALTASATGQPLRDRSWMHLY